MSFFPPHDTYIEPFGGAAGVLLQKEPVRIEIYNDLDQVVVNLFRVLRHPAMAEALRRAIELTPFSRGEFNSCWVQSDDPIEEARRTIVRSFQAIGAKNSLSRNGWRTRTSKSVWSPCTAWNGWPDQIPLYVNRLRNVIIESLDWQKIVEIYDAPGVLFYLDPPYPHGTRDPGHKSVYSYELSDAGHRHLLDVVQGIQGHVVLSSYPNDMYDSALGGELGQVRVQSEGSEQRAQSGGFMGQPFDHGNAQDGRVVRGGR